MRTLVFIISLSLVLSEASSQSKDSLRSNFCVPHNNFSYYINGLLFQFENDENAEIFNQRYCANFTKETFVLNGLRITMEKFAALNITKRQVIQDKSRITFDASDTIKVQDAICLNDVIFNINLRSKIFLKGERLEGDENIRNNLTHLSDSEIISLKNKRPFFYFRI